MGASREAPCGRCAACGKTVRMEAVLYTADARLVCPICFTKADVFAARRRQSFEGGGVALIGALAAVIPFASHVIAALMVTAIGARYDWVALAGGGIAVVCGGWTVLAAREQAIGSWLAIGALAMLIGASHVARGVGLIG